MTVVNCNNNPRAGDVYVGRSSRSVYGNPFSHLDKSSASVHVSSREEAVAAYHDWLAGVAWFDVEPERRILILRTLPNLRGKVLACHCAPLSCHGDILDDMANRQKGACVYAFRGRAYYGKAGIEYRPLEVSVDFGPWRATENEDGKAVREWLFDRGYISAYRVMGKGDACDYSEWFCLKEMPEYDIDLQPAELRLTVAIIKKLADERGCTTREAMKEGLMRKKYEIHVAWEAMHVPGSINE